MSVWTFRDGVWTFNEAEEGAAMYFAAGERGQAAEEEKDDFGGFLVHLDGNTIANNTAVDAGSGAAVGSTGEVVYRNENGDLDLRVIGNNVFVGNQPRNVDVRRAYVRWDYTLDNDLFAYHPGTEWRELERPVQGSASPLDLILFGVVAPPDVGCAHPHLHGPAGIEFFGYHRITDGWGFHGRFEDQAAGNCGYGKIYGGGFGEEPPEDDD